MGRNGDEDEHPSAGNSILRFVVRLQPIYDIAEICSQKNVEDAIVCPGSRCAPLTLAFSRHPSIKTRTISDERSAAFIALGIAREKRKPVVLICTSGTAAYNFAPAIAEAFFQEIPLIVLTADRPTEWIGQRDDQTIYQQGLYGQHTKNFYQLPQTYLSQDDIWLINRSVNEALNLSTTFPQGPVHINVPLREPLYETGTFAFSEDVRITSSQELAHQLSELQLNHFKEQIRKAKKVLLVAGQLEPNPDLGRLLEKFCQEAGIPIIGDVISNLHGLSSTVSQSELILDGSTDEEKEALQPDLLISIGKSVLSKNLKIYLRKYKPVQHWHVGITHGLIDPFQSITSQIPISPIDFLNQLGTIPTTLEKSAYHNRWSNLNKRINSSVREFFQENKEGEFSMVNQILQAIPENTDLHLANSMSVRYANMIGLTAAQKATRVYANRGTSGIDGCTSSAVGHALASERQHLLITGDMAFFYDRNAFWNNYPVPNLRVLILNNHGGAIFGIIPGPSDVPESAEYFITHQPLNARHLADEFGFEYLHFTSSADSTNKLESFFKPGQKTLLLEFESDHRSAQEILSKFKAKIKHSHAT